MQLFPPYALSTKSNDQVQSINLHDVVSREEPLSNLHLSCRSFDGVESSPALLFAQWETRWLAMNFQNQQKAASFASKSNYSPICQINSSSKPAFPLYIFAFTVFSKWLIGCTLPACETEEVEGNISSYVNSICESFSPETHALRDGLHAYLKILCLLFNFGVVFEELQQN